jgi:hypothetical protein
VAWEWIAPVGSGVVGVAGLVFGWAASGRSQRLTAALARESNAHAQALAKAANDHSRHLEELRYDHGERDRQRRRLEESYLEVATTVIRVSDAMREFLDDPDPAGVPADSRDELVRARALLGLFSAPEVRAAFDRWEDRLHTLTYSADRMRQAAGQVDPDRPPDSVRDLHSTRDLWRRQAQDARLKEVDAREHFIAALSGHLGPS